MKFLHCIVAGAAAFVFHHGCVSGCCNRAAVETGPGFDISQRVVLDFPATYSGILPCADCEGIRYTFNLWSDHVVFRRMTYLGKGDGEGASVDDVGRWSYSVDGSALIIISNDETPDYFAIEGRTGLRKLDNKGRRIDSDLDYTLARQAKVVWFEPKVRMHGMYSYVDGQRSFTECLSRLHVTVATDAQYPALEQSYAFARSEPGEATLVSLEGRIVNRPKANGQGKEQVFVIDKFLNLWAGETCWPEVKVASRSCGK